MLEGAAPILSWEFTGRHESATVHVRGQLTEATAGAFTTTLFASGACDRSLVVLDLSEVTDIDGYGERALAICERSLGEHGAAMIVTSSSRHDIAPPPNG